jgi:hypothetical protein
VSASARHGQRCKRYVPLAPELAWAVTAGKEICQLYTFPDGTWAVLDAHGKFDAANDGDVPYMHWTLGTETFPLRHFWDRYHQAGLLAKYLGLITGKEK